MESKLAKLIVEKFFEYLEKLSKKCCIQFDKCLIEFVSRQYIDNLVIDVYYQTLSQSANLGQYLQVPLVTIDFTHFKICLFREGAYNKYIKSLALKFLNIIEQSRQKIIDRVCCPFDKHKSPVNKCNCTYREEFTLCKPKCCPEEKPYDNWGKPCCVKKIRCKPHKEPKCPINIHDKDRCLCHEHSHHKSESDSDSDNKHRSSEHSEHSDHSDHNDCGCNKKHHEHKHHEHKHHEHKHHDHKHHENCGCNNFFKHDNSETDSDHDHDHKHHKNCRCHKCIERLLRDN